MPKSSSAMRIPSVRSSCRSAIAWASAAIDSVSSEDQRSCGEARRAGCHVHGLEVPPGERFDPTTRPVRIDTVGW